MAENKIISYDVELLSTNKRRAFYIPEVYTNDLYTNEFQFNIIDMTAAEFSGATATVLLNMRDGSFFNNADVTRSGNTFKYVLKENEGNHFGVAEVQLVVKISGKDYATPLYNFAVMQGLDDKKANEVVINDLNSETRKAINDLKTKWQQVINETTGKDVISAPEIIAARNGEANLKARLDKEKNEVTAQLAHTWYNIHSYPKLEGETTDTERLRRMITHLKEGDTIYLPNIDVPYLLDDTVVFDKNIHFRVEGSIKYIGDRNRPVLHFIRPVNIDIDIKRISSENIIDWGINNYIGVLVTNSYMSNINIERISGFDVGFKAQAKTGIADSGFWFNKIRIKRISNCRVGQELNSDGDGAWLNANEFHETAVGYDSGIPKTTLADRYNILQTLTNGNMIGGNNNYFYNYKLETHGGFNGSHTMVKLGKATDWLFRDFRKEVTDVGSNEREFVMDMFYNREDIITSHAHSFGNIIDGLHSFKIEFENVGQLKNSLKGIIRNVRDELNPLIEIKNLSGKTRRVAKDYSLLSNFVSSSYNSQTLDSDSPLFYRVNGIKEDGYVEVISSSSITQYITNVSNLDTFRIESKNSVIVRLYDIEGNIIENIRSKVAGFMEVNNSTNSINPLSNNPLEFSVVDTSIKTIKINLYGKVRNVVLLTDSSTAIYKRNLNPDLFKSGGFYSDIKPVFDKTFGFVVGDVVMNTKSSSSTPDGWQLKYNDGQYTWIDLL